MRKDAYDALIARAAFDLQCNAKELKVTPLGTIDSEGIEGCGKRTVYVFSNNSHGWVLNANPAEKQ